VPGKVLSTSLEAGEVVTVEGSPVEISLADGVKVNDANVWQPTLKLPTAWSTSSTRWSCPRKA